MVYLKKTWHAKIYHTTQLTSGDFLTRQKKGDKSRVVFHGVTSSFFGIGILLVSDLLGIQHFRRCQNFGGEPFFSQKTDQIFLWY